MTESTDNPNSNTRTVCNKQNSNINNNTHNNDNIHKNNIQNDNTSSTTSKERRKQQQRQDQDQQQQQQVPELMTTTTTTIAIEQGLSSTSPLPQMSSTLSPSAMAHRCPYCHRTFNKKYNLNKHLENLSCPNSKVPSWNYDDAIQRVQKNQTWKVPNELVNSKMAQDFSIKIGEKKDSRYVLISILN
jgi:hypothetical protein